MLFALILFICGVIILLFATDRFVILSSKISLYFKISPLIIGTTIVAVGTSLPEFAVSTTASFKGDFDLAAGNIIGSNIINILLVLGVAIGIGNLHVGTHKTQINSVLLVIITALFIVVGGLIYIPKLSGLILLVLAAAFTIYEYFIGLKGSIHEDKILFLSKNGNRANFTTIILLLIVLIGIIIGGYMIVYAVEKISVFTGISTSILGLSLTATATSMPELLTTIISHKQKQEKLILGNIIGSNIYNLLLIGGLVALFSPINTIKIIDWLTFFTTALLFCGIVFFYKGRTIPRQTGFILITLCGLYLYFLK